MHNWLFGFCVIYHTGAVHIIPKMSHFYARLIHISSFFYHLYLKHENILFSHEKKIIHKWLWPLQRASYTNNWKKKTKYSCFNRLAVLKFLGPINGLTKWRFFGSNFNTIFGQFKRKNRVIIELAIRYLFFLLHIFKDIDRMVRTIIDWTHHIQCII